MVRLVVVVVVVSLLLLLLLLMLLSSVVVVVAATRLFVDEIKGASAHQSLLFLTIVDCLMLFVDCLLIVS